MRMLRRARSQQTTSRYDAINAARPPQINYNPCKYSGASGQEIEIEIYPLQKGALRTSFPRSFPLTLLWSLPVATLALVSLQYMVSV